MQPPLRLQLAKIPVPPPDEELDDDPELEELEDDPEDDPPEEEPEDDPPEEELPEELELLPEDEPEDDEPEDDPPDDDPEEDPEAPPSSPGKKLPESELPQAPMAGATARAEAQAINDHLPISHSSIRGNPAPILGGHHEASLNDSVHDGDGADTPAGAPAPRLHHSLRPRNVPDMCDAGRSRHAAIVRPD
jgi:hypothetical protein